MVKAAGGRVWSPNGGALTQPLLKEARDLGLQVIPWTINEPADLRRLLGYCPQFDALLELLSVREHLQLFGRIKGGWHASRDSLLDATGQSHLLEANPALNNSIRLRLPYIEPLNLLQIELMKRHRAGEADERIGEGIQLTINAIATALRNSG